MRNALKYGIPAAAGLGAAGLVASQGGNPVEAGGAALAAGLGGAAGLVGARQLAGKYAPQLVERIQKGGLQGADKALNAAAQMPEGGIRQQALVGMADGITDLTGRVTERGMARATAAGFVPASAATAALGGVAAGQAVGAVGQMIGIDPELPGSSNTVNSRLNMQGMNYLPMY